MLRRSFQKQYFLVDGRQERTEVPATPEAPAPSEIPDCCTQCKKCGDVLLLEDWEKNARVCPTCGWHGRMGAPERLAAVFGETPYTVLFDGDRIPNPLEYPEYEEKIRENRTKSGLSEAVVIAEGEIEGIRAVVGVMDSRFMMGSMGSSVGERVTRAIEYAGEHRRPLVIFAASGGARMQEGIISLMQMAKTSQALGRWGEEGLLSVVVLTDPTTGGVTASFAMLGDIILAEPGALIGFAGPRVIEQTIRQTLPPGFQLSEFLLEKGFVDRIVPRSQLRETLATILRLHGGESG